MAGVEMRVTITSCMEDGATAKWNTIPVTFTVSPPHPGLVPARWVRIGSAE
jgi:hypothetical protein